VRDLRLAASTRQWLVPLASAADPQVHDAGRDAAPATAA